MYNFFKNNIVKQLICLAIFISVATSSSLHAQVTIGSPLIPNKGALLDLKEYDDPQQTSTKGLGMPKVQLQEHTSLKPALDDAQSADPAMRAMHTGLMVFNPTEANGFCKGLYAWDGDEWQPLVDCFTLNVDKESIIFPSNVATGIKASNVLNITWSPRSVSPTLTLSPAPGYNPVGGYTPTPQPSGGVFAENVSINAMTPGEIALNPASEKASNLDVTLTVGDKTITKRVFLYQVNDAFVYETAPYYLMDGSTYTFKVKSNTLWKAEVLDTGGNVLATLNTTQGGGNGILTENNVSFTVANDMPNPTKFIGTAKIRFYSETNRFADQVVELICASGRVVGQANSYIVKPSTAILIPVRQANADGTTRIAAGATYTADLVWTDNANRIANNSNIRMILPAGAGAAGYLYVAAGTAQGNAVVSAKVGATIAWSWHIWVLNEDPTATTYTYSNNVFMDRNLGAITATGGNLNSFGLYYQWGRKDPFPGSADLATSSPTEKQIYNAAGATATVRTSSGVNLGNSVQNPLTFFDGTSWTGSTANTSWAYNTNAKSVYDPCPEGWRVPPFRGTVSPWDGLTSSNSPSNASAVGRYFMNSNDFWPGGGRRNYTGSVFSFVTQYGGYWTDRPNTTSAAYSLNFNQSAHFNIAESYIRSYGLFVRCVKFP